MSRWNRGDKRAYDLKVDRMNARACTITHSMNEMLADVRQAEIKGGQPAMLGRAEAYAREVIHGLTHHNAVLPDDPALPIGVTARLRRVATLEIDLRDARIDAVLYAAKVLAEAKVEPPPSAVECFNVEDDDVAHS